MLEVEQVVWLANGKYVEYSKSRNVFNTRAITVVDINNF
jgi:GntR family transcriptional regulator